MPLSDRVEGPLNKRKISELNSSTDLEVLNKSMCTLLEEVSEKPENQDNDIVKLLTTFMKYSMAKEDEDKKKWKKVEELEEKSIEHDVVLECVQTEIKAVKGDMGDMQHSLNLLEQKRVDNDVFVSYFTSKPNADDVAKKILSISNTPENAIIDSYSFPITSRNTPTANSTQRQGTKTSKFALIMSFRDYRSKRTFLSSRKNCGPLKQSQLFQSSANDTTIRISNRLSAFNLRTLKGLHQAKDEKKIANFNMHNGLYRYQLEGNDQWHILSTDAQLESLLKPNEEEMNEND
jgi:hypothetical protein